MENQHSLPAYVDGATSDVDRELIVLVHGFGSSRAVMWPLARRLRASGFRVVQWNYLSLFAEIETHATRLHDFLATQLSMESRFHIVAHSMGSIIARAALNRSPIPNLGRLVFLAPPNHGTPVARVASLFVGSIISPMRELSDEASSYVNQLKGSIDFDVGIIAARFDVLVPIKSTHLREQRMHTTLTATHNSLVLSRTAFDQTVTFIRTGEFKIANSYTLPLDQPKAL